MAKVKTVGTISEFMSGGKRSRPALKRNEIRKHKSGGAAILVAGIAGSCILFGDASAVSANVIDGFVAEKVVNAFNPLVDLVRALSYPIGLVMMLGGGLFVMIGNSDRGFGMIQKAGLGYIIIQMLPIMMDLLVEIAQAM